MNLRLHVGRVSSPGFYLCCFSFSCVGGVDKIKYHNELELFEAIDPNVSI